MAVNPNGDVLERTLVQQTAADKLKSIASMQVVTTATVIGTITVQGIVSPTNTYKVEQRAQATKGEVPEDSNGLGYVFNNLTDTQV